MRRKRRRLRLISALLAMMALLVGSCMTAYAATDGSICVTLSYENEEGYAQDGSLTLYHVAEIAYDGSGNEVYAYTDAFAGCEVSLEDVSDDTNHALAAALTEYVSSNGIGGGTVYPVNSEDGVVSISGLPTGLYLLVQTVDSTEAYTFDPFMVSIPYNGSYDVDASPKVEVVASETTEPEPEDTVTISGSKTWVDEADGTRPDFITIHLFADDIEMKDQVKTVTADDDWSWTFPDLPKYSYDADGNALGEIVYTITEDDVDNYTTEVVGYNVINTYSPPDDSSGGGAGGGGTITPGSGSGGGSRISSGGTGSSSTPSTGSSTASTLPQTGQLFWPIPFLAGGGVLFLLIGYLMRRSGRRKMADHAA